MKKINSNTKGIVRAGRKPFSAIGLGCVTFGREIGERDAFELMDSALVRGINLFDTAASYGGGESEMIVGKWLSSRRPEPNTLWVTTKVQPPYNPGKIESGVEESRNRLGVDQIDTLYLHAWDKSCERPDTLATLNGLVKKGKVRSLGASNFTAPQLKEILRRQRMEGYIRISMIQNNHNLAVRQIGEELLRLCDIHNITVVSYSPLGAGFLTGKYLNGIAEGTRFDLVPGHQKIYFTEQSLMRLRQLQQVAKESGQAPEHLALAWVMHQRGIDTVLVGGRTLQHLDQAYTALRFNDPELFDRLR